MRPKFTNVDILTDVICVTDLVTVARYDLYTQNKVFLMAKNTGINRDETLEQLAGYLKDGNLWYYKPVVSDDDIN